MHPAFVQIFRYLRRRPRLVYCFVGFWPLDQDPAGWKTIQQTLFVFSRLDWNEHTMEAHAGEIICIWKDFPASASVSYSFPVQPWEYEYGILDFETWMIFHLQNSCSLLQFKLKILDVLSTTKISEWCEREEKPTFISDFYPVRPERSDNSIDSLWLI